MEWPEARAIAFLRGNLALPSWIYWGLLGSNKSRTGKKLKLGVELGSAEGAGLPAYGCCEWTSLGISDEGIRMGEKESIVQT